MAVLRWRKLHRVGVLLPLWLGLMTGCADMTATVMQRLDPLTGATLVRADAPMRFAHDNSGRAAYARDFVYLGPLSVNTMGDYRYYLWIGAWSTHGDTFDAVERRDAFETITVFADGEPLSFDVAAWTYESLGVSSAVYDQPVATAIDAYYRLTFDQIRLLAEADDIHILAATGQRYEPWSTEQRGRQSLRAFVYSTPP